MAGECLQFTYLSLLIIHIHCRFCCFAFFLIFYVFLKTTFGAKKETIERTTGNHFATKFTDEHFAEYTLCFLVLSVVANTCNKKLVTNKESDLRGREFI